MNKPSMVTLDKNIEDMSFTEMVNLCKKNGVSEKGMSKDRAKELVLLLVEPSEAKGRRFDLSIIPVSLDGMDTDKQVMASQRKAARRLVRVQVSQMNPDKVEWVGETITVSNGSAGTIERYIHFGVPQHVEQMFLNVLKERKRVITYKARDAKGNQVTRYKEGPEFAIAILPHLSEADMDKLGSSQSMRDGKTEEEEY